jgi:hypothetical membrane protein
MEWIKIYYPILSVGYIGLCILAAHVVAGKQYSRTQNTISDLGAQGYDRGWIMRMGFVGFGLIMCGGILLKFMEGTVFYLVDIPILLYAMAILFSGIFSTEPLEEGKSFSQMSDALHSVFVKSAGIALIIALLMSALLAPNSKIRMVHVLFLVLVTLISGILGFRKKHSGVIQRLLFLVCFIWLIVGYNI